MLSDHAIQPQPFGPSGTKQQGADAYTFIAEPRPAQPKKKREGDVEKNSKVNIMYDRRIHRGNTYAAPIGSNLNQPDPLELQKQQEIKRKLRAKQKAESRRRVKTPDPVSGRKNMDVQTDLYLEELCDKVPEAFAATQTDAFLNRAPSPLFVPQKSGLDVSTQIYQGDLFDFDLEVTPILELIVGKTLEQALLEVQEEEELYILRQHQKNFQKIRNAEIVEIQRMEDAERRRTEEKQRRLDEQIRVLKEKQDATEKIAARAFAQGYLQSLMPTVWENLSNNGYFYDKIEKEIETETLPWLTNGVLKNIGSLSKAQTIIDDIIMSAINNYRSAFLG